MVFGYLTCVIESKNIYILYLKRLACWLNAHHLTFKCSAPIPKNRHPVSFCYCCEILAFDVRECSQEHLKALLRGVKSFRRRKAAISIICIIGGSIFEHRIYIMVVHTSLGS